MPRRPPSQAAVSIRAGTSSPVANPARCSIQARSSVGTLPVAAGANGQPPNPPMLASSTRTPASHAAQALAIPVLRVLWKWQRRATPGAASRTRVMTSATWLGTPEPMVTALALADGSPRLIQISRFIVSLGAVIAMSSVLLVFQLGQPRIFMSMARDGLLPPFLARVHPRFKTPYIGTIITGLFVATFAAFANIAEVVDLTNIGTLFAFVLVSAGVIVLRRLEPDRVRPFRAPWVPFTPLLSIVTCLYLMMQLPALTWIRFGIWLLIGLVVYFAYGMHHSRLGRRSKGQA